MTEPHKPSADEARQALDTVEKMTQSARQHGMPPRWFGAVVAVLAGSLIALAVADLREMQVLVVAAIVIVVVYQARKTQVTIGSYPLPVLLLAPPLLVGLYFGLMLAAQQIATELGQGPAALITGIALASSVYVLSLFERQLLSGRKNPASSS